MKKMLQENKIFIITILVVVVLFQIRLPYYVDAPGGTIDISNRISYQDQVEYDGSLNMLYVTEYVATIPTYLLSYVMKDWDLESISSNQLSDESPEEINFRNKIMLENSINNAKYVAYREAGQEITVKSQKNVVIGTTVDNGLEIGDEILEVNHKKVVDLSEIKEEIDASLVGAELHVKIKRDDQNQDKMVKVQEIEGKKALGVVIVTNYEYELSPEIELKFKSSESGSSGGLMMALSIYSAISGEDILKGRNIAGTGTIDNQGNVGEISGVKYKIIGAHKNKMDIVLVPSANYEEACRVAKERNYEMEIVEIKTFEEAIQYLKNHD